MSKRETIEEYLARGGTITRVDAQPVPDEEQRVNPMNSGGGLMTLAEGSIFYSEIKATPPKKKTKSVPAINFSALPASLLKYVNNLKKDD